MKTAFQPERHARASSARDRDHHSAFTLIELLVVIAIIAILAALIAPTLARAKSYGKRTACVANYRQLQLAWHMYIDDFGRLPRNKIDYLAGTFPDSPNWVAGTLQIMDGWSDNTNTVQMVNAFGGIGVYLKTPKVYKCPEDRSIATFGPRRHPRARSVAMNNWMGVPSQISISDVRSYATVSDLLAGLPVENGFVFIDTHPDSIATGMFVKTLEAEFWDQFPPASTTAPPPSASLTAT